MGISWSCWVMSMNQNRSQILSCSNVRGQLQAYILNKCSTVSFSDDYLVSLKTYADRINTFEIKGNTVALCMTVGPLCDMYHVKY